MWAQISEAQLWNGQQL
ncbi:unnamed protein product, partial [Rotaria sp. Silwood1]